MQTYSGPRPSKDEIFGLMRRLWSDPSKGTEQTRSELRELAQNATFLADTLEEGTWKVADVLAHEEGK